MSDRSRSCLLLAHRARKKWFYPVAKSYEIGSGSNKFCVVLGACAQRDIDLLRSRDGLMGRKRIKERRNEERNLISRCVSDGAY